MINVGAPRCCSYNKWAWRILGNKAARFRRESRASNAFPSCSVWPKHTEWDRAWQNLPRRHGWGFLSAQRGTKAASSSVHLCKTGRSEPTHSTFTLTQTALRKGRNSDQNRVLVRDGGSCPWRQKRRKHRTVRHGWRWTAVCVCVCVLKPANKYKHGGETDDWEPAVTFFTWSGSDSTRKQEENSSRHFHRLRLSPDNSEQRAA